MTIAFFVTSLNSGGIENYLLRFLQFSENKFEVTVFCKSGYIGDLEQEYLKAGATIVPFRLGMFSILDYYKLYKELKSKDFHSVVDFTGNFAALPLLIAKKAGIKKRITFYRGSTNHFKEDFFRLTYNNFLNQLIPKVSTSILSNSKAAFNFFFGEKWKSDDKFEVIYNGINTNTFLTTKQNLRKELRIPETAFVVGHIGRYNVAKNHKTMIKVATDLCENNSEIYFVFCGDKVIQGLEQEVRHAKLERQVKLLGFRKDVIEVLNTLDCFYFPSLTEGQPNALIEALVSGLPFVASNIEPIKETVPLDYHKQLIDPLESELALKKILGIKNEKEKENNTTPRLSEIIKERFDSEVLFTKFLNHL